MNKKRLFAFGLGSLTILGVTSVAFSLAAYVNGYYSMISPVSITLRSEPNILISTSDKLETFKQTLNKDELKKVDEFHPVSSMYSDRWISESSDYPKFAGDFSHVNDQSIPVFTETGFYSQELYLYSQDDVYVTFDKNLFTFSANKEKNRQTAKTLRGRFPSLTEEQIYENLNAIPKSLRASILLKNEASYEYYIYDPFKEEDTLLAGILDTDMDQYFDYDASVSEEIVHGEYQNKDKIVYQPGTSEDVPYTGINTCFNSGHKAHMKQFDLDASIANGFAPAIEKSYSSAEIEDKMKIPVKDEKPTRFVLSLYLEGWDKDNTNMVEFASFNVDIQFKIKGDIL